MKNKVGPFHQGGSAASQTRLGGSILTVGALLALILAGISLVPTASAGEFSDQQNLSWTAGHWPSQPSEEKYQRITVTGSQITRFWLYMGSWNPDAGRYCSADELTRPLHVRLSASSDKAVTGYFDADPVFGAGQGGDTAPGQSIRFIASTPVGCALFVGMVVNDMFNRGWSMREESGETIDNFTYGTPQGISGKAFMERNGPSNETEFYIENRIETFHRGHGYNYLMDRHSNLKNIYPCAWSPWMARAA